MERTSPGKGVLRFERHRERTIATETFSRSPLKFLAPGNTGHTAWIYSSNFGGGFVGGDSIDIDVSLAPETEAVFLSQASTKVYRSQDVCRQTVKVEVGKGAVFYSLPDPVVCFAGARFSQRQDIQLEEDASLILLDSLHSGREHSGERWVFDRYQNEIHVSRGGKKIFFESQLLDSVIGDLKKRQSRFNAYSLLLIIGKAFVNEVAGILNVIQSRPLEANEDFVCAASPVGTDGVIVRMVSVSTESMAVATRELLYFLPKKLGDDPWARKW